MTGCASSRSGESSAVRPGIAPTTRPAPADVLALDASLIKPMHREILAVDLTAALRAARAGNLDIRQARQQVEAARGRWQSDVGGALPALGVTAPFEHVDGTLRESQGSLIGVGFNTFQPAAAVQWITNPGQVIYDLIASRKRLLASGHQEQAVILETLRQTGVQFYDLALAQTRVATAHQAVAEAEELLRISRLRSRTGTGVPADEMRAEARLAERQQDLVLAVNEFYRASVALAVTLHLDPAVTLVPSVERLPQVTLVRDDLSLDDLVELAVVHRPDLKQVRRLAEGAAALRGATWWGAFGPQFQVGYQYGGITGHSNNTEEAQGIPNNLIVNPLSATGAFSTNPVVNGFIREGISRGSARLAHRGDETFGFSDQERFNAAAGWRFTLAAFGDLKAARAAEAIALLEAERQVEQVQAQVVLALESSKTQAQLVGLSQRQVAFAQEALRLSQANLQAGTMTTLDVLQAQDAVNQARLRQAEAVVRYNQAQVNLVGAIGLLDDASATKDDMLGPGRNAE